ncbi:DUF1329 domain-containing protein [Burkholderia sp. Bp9142]|uniref:DUF1329 domain-containing protein n=1 Tax=Burkholderia sp. Bp9142 TaxID=2184573 RepID=UPI000F5943C4|nr:DUF1329 domain-containing protein [Burkholderia sp. Bp9142]RQR27563.1 DUF1329 domain-containing protein [Burkholderia sp. Bp9142]
MKTFDKLVCHSVFLSSLVVGAGAWAAELPAGTVIEKSNIDTVKSDTFDGHPISSLLTEKVAWQIRNWNLKITLDHAKPIPAEPRLVEATKKYSGQVKFDPKTKEVTGYVAGVPFPDIETSDPDAGYKMMWNFYYAPREGDTVYNDVFALAVNGNSGLETKQAWIYQRYYFKNRLLDKQPVAGDGTIAAKTYDLAQYPEDVKGIGTFAVRLDSPSYEETWAYLKSARRTRRLSGGAWMDPVGGLDFLGDDNNVFNARPSWYKGFKVTGKRWILAVTDGNKNNHVESRSGTADEFPTYDLKNAPYWNPIEKWQPREVYVVEATPPDQHPYSKRVMYLDVDTFRPYYSENYDKKGEFWKFVISEMRAGVSEGGQHVLLYTGVEAIDFKARHATVAPIVSRADPRGITDSHWSLSGLEQLAK